MQESRLKVFLKNNNITYRSVTHPQVFTSQETAESAHISGKELAKTVMVKIDNNLAMAVLPSSYNIDFAQFKESTGAGKIELAKESEFEDLFPECETGAMPPFGNLYGMHVFVDDHLCQDHEITFNAGTHKELITLLYRDFERLVHPEKTQFAC
jgi:Ala-tRNA(Pro) deacylase